MSFVQLEVMSTNSLMRSTLTVEELIIHAKERGYRALALTDQNVLFGAVEFYELALKHGIQPIIGLTLSTESITGSEDYSLILLAKNYAGYQSLIELSSEYQLNDKKPVQLEKIVSKAEDLIVISPGDHSELLTIIDQENTAKIIERVSYYMQNFPNFYQGVNLQNYHADKIQKIQDLKIPIVALGNVKYLNPVDALPTKVLEVLNSEMTLQGDDQEKINHYLFKEQEDYSLQNAEKNYEAFKAVGLEKAAQQTVKIAKEISIELPLGQHFMPSFPLKNEENADDYLRSICEENLTKRVNQVSSEYQERLNKELAVISEMGFSDYFLIVWDIMLYAHREGIYTGSGRGSAAGSLVAYLLKITNVDPIKFDLLFERFLNKDRASLPDIDLDFPDNRREEILDYIFIKYGSENVAQIGTIGKFGAKSAVRDVGRVFGLTQDELKKWSQAIPTGPNVSLKGLKNYRKLVSLVEKNDLNRTIYETALKIEGANRHVSTHAAGIVISDDKLMKRVPLQEGNSSMHLTQYTMDAVEKVGLLKLDILGLRNLATLADCIRFIPYENEGKAIDIDAIPFDDAKTLAIFQKGNTDGIFQFESPGIRQELRKLEPSSFEDIVAVNALYRPGPMQQIDTFIKRKHGKEEIQYPHPDLKEILENTYGIIVYQEQVMKVATKLAGYTLNEADILRRAIGKKDREAIDAGRQEFIRGAIKNNYTEETASSVYNYIEKFADYGFNRSHAVAYSKVAYQLAYVKANYPASFFAAIMKTSSKAKSQSYLSEARRYDVKMLAPNINKSFYSFILEDGKILAGFNLINGLSKEFIQEIIRERKENGSFKGLIDFTKRMDKKWLTEKQILPLIESGAMDHLEKNRNTLLHSLKNVLENVQMSHGNEALIQLFSPKIIEKEELSDEEKMEQEYERTGLYFTAEPGEKYKDLRKNPEISYVSDIAKDKRAKVLVVVKNIKNIQTKNGKPMSFIDAVDTTGKVNLTLFPENHRRYIQKIKVDDTLLVEGEVSKDSRGLRLLVNQLIHADEVIESKQEKIGTGKTEKILYIRFKSLEAEQQKFLALQELLKEYRGSSRVIIYDEATEKQNFLKREYAVNLDSEIVNKLKKMFGEHNLVIQARKRN